MNKFFGKEKSDIATFTHTISWCKQLQGPCRNVYVRTKENIPRSAVSLGSRPTCTILFLRPVSKERFSKSRRVMFSRSSCSQGTIFTSFSTISISTCISRKRKIHNPSKLSFVVNVKALSVCYVFTCMQIHIQFVPITVTVNAFSSEAVLLMSLWLKSCRLGYWVMLIKKVFEPNSSDVLEIFLTVGILQECGQDITCKTRFWGGGRGRNSFRLTQATLEQLTLQSKIYPTKKDRKLASKKNLRPFIMNFKWTPRQNFACALRRGMPSCTLI